MSMLLLTPRTSDQWLRIWFAAAGRASQSTPGECADQSPATCRQFATQCTPTSTFDLGPSDELSSLRRCCAELNVLLQSFSNRLYEIPVAGCHTWTRAAKATTFDYMAQECQQSTHPRARMQLQMVSHLLNSILRDHLDLSIRKSTLNLEQSPVWLKSWCQRWGFTDHYMSILELEAYPLSLENLPFSIFRGESGSTGQCTVYVPCTF